MRLYGLVARCVGLVVCGELGRLGLRGFDFYVLMGVAECGVGGGVGRGGLCGWCGVEDGQRVGDALMRLRRGGYVEVVGVDGHRFRYGVSVHGERLLEGVLCRVIGKV